MKTEIERPPSRRAVNPLGRASDRTSSEASMISFLREFCAFLSVRKKFWLLPVFIMMAIFGGLIVLTQGSAVAPFIYTLF